ncbi:MAG: hypothetical protein L3J39_14015 [Verrucomicrobiales bacterium]|nr:hypothetical protein [Verrucomicrobiales bacterium]
MKLLPQISRRTLSILLLALTFSITSLSAADSAARFLKNAQKGDLALKSIGRLAFGPDGLLLLSDPRSASILAIDTHDRGPLLKLENKIENIDTLLAQQLKVTTDSLTIIDMAVNPASGSIYFSLNLKPGNQPVLLTVDGKGQIQRPDLSTMEYVRITLPVSENSKLRNVTDLAWADSSVIVAGQSNEEFANKIYQIPVPLENGINARYFSAETYHVSHKRWETKAPIQSFIPYEENGEFYIVGAFACTPIAKFPLSGIESGKKIKGISIVELGSGNRPRDMFTYEKDGKQWLVTNTKRFHEKFGPSVYWGARVDMEYLKAAEETDTNENAPRRNMKAPNGPDAKGIEVVDALYGAVLVSQLDNEQIIVLREDAPDSDTHHLEPVTLP